MCAVDLGWIAQAFKQQNEQSSDIWDGLSKTGQYLNNAALEKQKLEQDQQYKQAQIVAEQQRLAATKEHQDRSYQLDYQRTMQGTKANQLKDSIALQKEQRDQTKAEHDNWDFNNKVERDNYMKQNADKYAKAIINKDASILSKEDLAILPPNEQINLLKTISGSSQDLINREKNRIFDAIGDSYVGMIDGINVDPKDGSSNATEVYKDFLKTKIQPMINSGMYDKKAIADVTNYFSSMVGKTASMKKGSMQNTMAPDIVTEYQNPITREDFTNQFPNDKTQGDKDMNNTLINDAAFAAASDQIGGKYRPEESYALNSPENIQRYQESLLANKVMALQDRGKGGVLNSVKLQGGSSGKKKKESSDADSAVMAAFLSGK